MSEYHVSAILLKKVLFTAKVKLSYKPYVTFDKNGFVSLRVLTKLINN